MFGLTLRTDHGCACVRPGCVYPSPHPILCPGVRKETELLRVNCTSRVTLGAGKCPPRSCNSFPESQHHWDIGARQPGFKPHKLAGCGLWDRLLSSLCHGVLCYHGVISVPTLEDSDEHWVGGPGQSLGPASKMVQWVKKFVTRGPRLRGVNSG